MGRHTVDDCPTDHPAACEQCQEQENLEGTQGLLHPGQHHLTDALRLDKRKENPSFKANTLTALNSIDTNLHDSNRYLSLRGAALHFAMRAQWQ